jgi:uncharacterized protein YjbI with pentapeptide repeats
VAEYDDDKGQNPPKRMTAAEFLRRYNEGERDFRGVNLKRAKLEGAKLEKVNLKGANLKGASLKGADLFGAYLEGVDLRLANLKRADLGYAHLEGANLEGANLEGANLEGANLRLAHLEGANFYFAHLKGAVLRRAFIIGANLFGAHLEGANLFHANLKGTTLNNANLSDADITGVRFNRTETYQGIRIATAHGNAIFKRYAQDQDYIETYGEYARERLWLHPWWNFWHPDKWPRIWVWLWKHTSDYGRSFARWAAVSVALAMIFGLIMMEMGEGSFEVKHNTGPFAYIYYSVVTFTTLGFGDIVPKTWPAQLLVTAEVILGYIMLGGLISILANKVARRS